MTAVFGPGRLNRATLARQMLLERQTIPVAEAVRRLVGLQAQSPASPYLALWNRVAGFDPAGLDDAFASGALVKATLMRITLHAVHAGDYPFLHSAVLRVLRGARLGDRRFTRTGLSAADVDGFLPELIGFAVQPRAVGEIEALLAGRFGGDRQGLWWALRTFAALHHVPSGGPWSFNAGATGRSFTAAPTTVPVTERDESVRELVRRYLAGYGPATIADMSQFTLLPRTVLRDAVRALGDELTVLPGGILYDVSGAPSPPEDTPAPPRLLPMWDNVLLAYADRGRLIPPQYRKAVIRPNGDVLPTILVNGHVAGVWRAIPDGIEATSFHPLPRATWDALAAEAAALTTFLVPRDPSVYSRHAHWWSKPLPAAETRTLSTP